MISKKREYKRFDVVLNKIIRHCEKRTLAHKSCIDCKYNKIFCMKNPEEMIPEIIMEAVNE